jgi:hypothetical protein
MIRLPITKPDGKIRVERLAAGQSDCGKHDVMSLAGSPARIRSAMVKGHALCRLSYRPASVHYTDPLGVYRFQVGSSVKGEQYRWTPRNFEFVGGAGIAGQ